MERRIFMTDGPRINDRFPIKESLSPPRISPVSECAQAVYVTGFVPHATVRVFANLTDQLGEDSPPFGFAEIELNRCVKQGESLTATQTVGNQTSTHSSQSTIVTAVPQSAIKNTKPEVGKDLFDCGIIVPVGNLVPSVRVHVREDSQEIGNEPVAKSWHPVVTSPLHVNRRVSAIQVACEECEDTSHNKIESPWSDQVIVQPAPTPVPAPIPDGGSLIPGNDTVTLTKCLVGAGVEIFDQGASVSTGWYATSSKTYFPISSPISVSSVITATQELCGVESQPSDPVHPSGKLNAPIIVEPICNGARFVLIRGTTINANVVVLRNGGVVGYGGATHGDLILELGGNASLHTNDVVTCVQYVGQTISPVSNAVTVGSGLGQPVIEILGGESFFLAKGNEQPIDGPVFPRGRGIGPVIRVQACCTKNVRISILDTNSNVIAKPPLTELFPGYYEATLQWNSVSGWSTTDQIPVGKYLVTAETDCDQRDARLPFYLIFNPDDVGGPPRFSFEDTAVWFGTGSSSVRGLHYFLHPSDLRVFSIAITAASGHTDPYDAAIDVARAEESLFAYSLAYHTQDVVDLLVNFTDAQCADDACCLTALLRAVGIPAHPVTADAALETGAANWTFDTWIEFLAPRNGVTDWRIFHPHEYPGMQPESRSTFGSTRGVATKGFNDIVIMANEDWVFSQISDGAIDVSYSRNACQEPNQQLNKAAWIDELCEHGYWTQSHWECAGVSSHSLHSNGGFRFHERELNFSGRLTGTLEAVNRAKERRFGLLVVELVTNRLESKQFPEEFLGRVITRVALDNGESLTVPFDLRLPETLSPGQELFLWAHLDGHTVLLQEVRIQPLLSCHVTSQFNIQQGESVTITSVIHNKSKDIVRMVDVELIVPYVFQVEQVHHRLGDIKPYDFREVSWKLRVLAPLNSGSIRVLVSSANGGGIVVNRPFTIEGPAPEIDSLPGTHSKTKSRRK